MCGHGTGIGQVDYEVCAKQMKKAYDDFWIGNNKFPETWHEAQANHQLLYTSKVKDIQFN